MFSYFSTAQTLFLIVVTEVLIWHIITQIIGAIKHGITARSYKHTLENGCDWKVGQLNQKEEK